MTDRHVFTSQNNYARLEEALESIVSDENNDAQYDVFLLPPDPAIVSDEEEGNEDDLSSTTLHNDFYNFPERRTGYS
ncbi:unnamed protein product [Parnassius apollo]|uniref:(apollo) hypothetical protein n=1 Tax=Parnassius apollo TaxID=110799 RepID=A0A8S3YAY2_PARAO|nr:unnamed protein product [Parnassius apollo]